MKLQDVGKGESFDYEAASEYLKQERLKKKLTVKEVAEAAVRSPRWYYDLETPSCQYREPRFKAALLAIKDAWNKKKK